MKKSDQINELAAALAAAQGEYALAPMDGTNPHLRSRFGTLAGMVRATRPALTRHGLAVTQAVESGESGAITIDTMLIHASGQWISSSVSGTPPDAKGLNPLQAVGVFVSYMRRYSYAAMVGIVPSDDEETDGEVAAPPPPQSRAIQPAADATATTAMAATTAMPDERFFQLLPQWVASGKDADAIIDFCAKKGQPLTDAQAVHLRDELAPF